MPETAVLPSTETPIPLNEARKLVPGRERTRQTLWRWCVEGMGGVRLEHIRVGGELLTSEEALRRFFERVTLATAEQRARKDRASTDPERRAAVKQAESELDEAGL